MFSVAYTGWNFLPLCTAKVNPTISGDMAERLVLRIPGVSGIYTTVQQIVGTFGSKSRTFTKAVMVEFPRKGCWVVGFLTNRAQGELQARVTGEVWSVFIPTSPNPTSGFLVLVPAGEIVELEMTAGEAMKLIISGGAIAPAWPVSRQADPAGRNR